jgi:hypothetical protein
MARRSKLPDLGDLFGDPYQQREDITDAPDPVKYREVEEQLRAQIEALPRGSMGPSYDDLDPSSDPNNPYFDHTPREGLTDHEMDILYQAQIGKLNAIGRSDWEAMEAASEEREQQAAALWDEYRHIAPELAQDTQAVAAAIERVDAEIRYRGLNPDTYIQTHRTEYLRNIRDEQELPGITLPRDLAASFDRRNADASRTAGIAGGSGAASGAQASGAIFDGKRWSKDQSGQLRPDDMIDDIASQQRRSGYY